MSFSPCLVRSLTAGGDARFELGHPLVDRYLEFVAGAGSAEHVAGGGVRPEDVLRGGRRRIRLRSSAADVFEFLAQQRGDRTVVRLVGSASRGCRRARSLGGCRRCRGSTRIVVARGDTSAECEPGAAWVVDPAAGRVAPVPDGAVGAGAADVAEDPVARARSIALLGALRTRSGPGDGRWRCCWAGCAAARCSACGSRTCGW